MSAQSQSFRRIEPTHPQNAYASSLTTNEPLTLKPPHPPSVSLTPPTYAHSPYGSTHPSPITPLQSDDFWSTNPYAQQSLTANDMLTAQPHPSGYNPSSSSLQYPSSSDFSRPRATSLQQPLPSAYESTYTTAAASSQREFYSPGQRPSLTGPNPYQQAAPPRRPSAQYLSSLTHSSHPPQQQGTPPGIRVDERDYGRARANSGDSLFITTMEELRINPNPTARSFGEQSGYLGGGGGDVTRYGEYYGQGRGQGEGRGRRM